MGKGGKDREHSSQVPQSEAGLSLAEKLWGGAGDSLAADPSVKELECWYHTHTHTLSHCLRCVYVCAFSGFLT